MFVCTSYRGDDAQYLSFNDEKFELSNVVLELTNKTDHDKLQKYQKNCRFRVEKDGKNIEFTFDLKLSDTSLGECLLYQNDFSKLKNRTIYLFVCTVHVCKHTLFRTSPATIHKADKTSWHFLETDSKVDVVTKHKGIIQQLSTADLLLFAGEIYKEDDKFIYNIQSGCLRDMMFKNDENLYLYHERKKKIKPNCNYFYKRIVKPIFDSLVGIKGVFDNLLRKKYGREVNYQYLFELIKKYPKLNYSKKLVTI
jgi:hypothetical protein